jgi:hypothetical protein
VRPRRVLAFAPVAVGGLIAGTLVAATGPASAAVSAARASAPAVSFGVPRIVDPIRDYGEPGIAVNPKTGAVDVSGPMGTGVQRSGWDISVNGGQSFREVSAYPNGVPNPVPSKSALGPGGGDTDIAIDHAGTTFFTDLWALLCQTAAVTPNDGVSVTSNGLGCSHPPSDRPWYALYDPTPAQAKTTTSPYYKAEKSSGGTNANGTLKNPLLYLSYNDLAFGAQLDKSTNGLTFTAAGTAPDAQGSPPGVYNDGAKDNAGHAVTANDTPIIVDQRTGDVLAMGTTSVGPTYGLSLAVGKPDSSGDTTFKYYKIAVGLHGDPATLFPVLAEDQARNLYAVWVENCGTTSAGGISDAECFRVRYSYASAASGWTHWSAPRYVTPAGHTAVMPWVAAGRSGLIDVVWYDTPSRTDPSHVQSGLGRAWYPYFAQISHAASGKPVYRLDRIGQHPSHYNSICLNGTGCIESKGDRNLADFFEDTIDRDGRALVVFADTSNSLIQSQLTTTDGFLDHRGAEQDEVAIQNTGLNAWTGRPLVADDTTRPIQTITSPAGDALVNKALGGTEDPGLDITAVKVRSTKKLFTVAVTTRGGSLAAGAQAAASPYGQLTVRWQHGNTLWYATAQQDAAGATGTTWAAGKVSSIDLCSVSACDPHYFVYGGPQQGGTAITGTIVKAHSGAVTYTFRIPRSLLGSPKEDTVFDQMMAFTTTAEQSNDVPITNAQAEVEEGLPVVADATRDFNTAVDLDLDRPGHK